MNSQAAKKLDQKARAVQAVIADCGPMVTALVVMRAIWLDVLSRPNHLQDAYWRIFFAAMSSMQHWKKSIGR